MKGRLHPGKIFLVDTKQGRIIDDEEIKAALAAEHPYADWLRQNTVRIQDLPAHPAPDADHETVLTRQIAFGYTHEDLRLLLAPMAKNGEEPIGSMGTDTALAVLSGRPRPLYDYFKQLFAQVTNPPLDQIREELVTSMESTVGPERNLLKPEPESCRQIVVPDPVISNDELARIRHVAHPWFKAVTLPMLYPPADGAAGLERALEDLQQRASAAIADGANIVILSDRGVSRQHAAIPSLLATAGRAPSPRAARRAHALRADHRDRRRARSPSHVPADRVRRGRGEPVGGVRDPGRHGRPGPAAGRRSREGREELRQGPEQGDPQGHGQDGDLDAPELHAARRSSRPSA